MSFSRRFFLIGAGALITKAFLSKAVAHAERTGGPLLVAPDRVEGELYRLDDGLISLGPYQLVDEIPVPTWREFLPRSGRVIETRADLQRVMAEWFLVEDDLDSPMDELTWEMHWDLVESPTARAYRLLDKLDLGALRDAPGRGMWGKPLEFIEGAHPGDSSRWVTAEDPVTASLLQARLIELGTGLRLLPAY